MLKCLDNNVLGAVYWRLSEDDVLFGGAEDIAVELSNGIPN